MKIKLAFPASAYVCAVTLLVPERPSSTAPRAVSPVGRIALVAGQGVEGEIAVGSDATHVATARIAGAVAVRSAVTPHVHDWLTCTIDDVEVPFAPVAYPSCVTANTARDVLQAVRRHTQEVLCRDESSGASDAMIGVVSVDARARRWDVEAHTVVCLAGGRQAAAGCTHVGNGCIAGVIDFTLQFAFRSGAKRRIVGSEIVPRLAQRIIARDITAHGHARDPSEVIVASIEPAFTRRHVVTQAA